MRENLAAADAFDRRFRTRFTHGDPQWLFNDTNIYQLTRLSELGLKDLLACQPGDVDLEVGQGEALEAHDLSGDLRGINEGPGKRETAQIQDNTLDGAKVIPASEKII